MKLVSQAGEAWQYQLNHQEAEILLGLVRQFPCTEMERVQFSKTDENPQAVARKTLLAESLAQHRQELQGLAANLLGEDRWRESGTGRVLTLNSAAREILLQILNDIRVGCWRALGEPDPLELPITSQRQLAYRQTMDLAGYFEMNLLSPED